MCPSPLQVGTNFIAPTCRRWPSFFSLSRRPRQDAYSVNVLSAAASRLGASVLGYLSLNHGVYNCTFRVRRTGLPVLHGTEVQVRLGISWLPGSRWGCRFSDSPAHDDRPVRLLDAQPRRTSFQEFTQGLANHQGEPFTQEQTKWFLFFAIWI